MNKTTVLAITVAFMVGTTMSFVVSDFEAEAKKGENQGIGTSPNDEILAMLVALEEQVLVLDGNIDEIQAAGDIHGEESDDSHDTIGSGLLAIETTTDSTNSDVGIIKLDVTDIISKQIVSKKILCGIATSPDCLGP